MGIFAFCHQNAPLYQKDAGGTTNKHTWALTTLSVHWLTDYLQQLLQHIKHTGNKNGVNVDVSFLESVQKAK